MASLRTTVTLLALAMLVSVPSAAAFNSNADCEDFEAASAPYLDPSVDLAYVELCDEDGDGNWDTATFETNRVYMDGKVSVTDETKQRWDHQDRETQAEARVSPGVPGTPIVYLSSTAEDEGNDGQIDNADHELALHAGPGSVSEIGTVVDDDGDSVPDGYGLTVCSFGVGCATPGPRDVPNPPERIDLPDTVIDVGDIYIP